MKYRPEVDGLRAVAVVPVILFHAGVGLFSGGYVGVDVFFVISGYLIAGILISELERDTFSIVRFYARRAKRILPALFFVMLLCVPAAWVIMLPTEFKDFSQSLIAVTLFSSNFLFWIESDYFAPAAELKPLLHTWSLAVEEQYYLVFPVFLYFFWKFGRSKVILSICLLALMSLAASEWAWRSSPSANFYLAPTRAWELLVGALCAFAPEMLRRRWMNWLSVLGLLMIVASVFIYDHSTPFPSLYTLLPVVGCALVILFAREDTWATFLLSRPICVGIGLISYSLYLWHQPLFAFARLQNSGEPAASLMSALTVATFGLAYFTWRFVETPFRSPEISHRAIFSMSGACGFVFLALGLTGHVSNGSPIGDGFSPAQRQLLAYSDYDSAGLYREGDCFLETAQVPSEFRDFCVSAENQMFIVGDSHAAALSVGLREVFDTGQLTAHGCPPLIGYSSLSQPNCSQILEHYFAELERLKPEQIILHAHWGSHVGKELFRLEATIAEIQRTAPASNILLVGGVPTWSPSLPAALVRARAQTEDERLLYSDIHDTALADAFLRNLATQYGVEFVSLIDALCEGQECLAVVGDAGEPVPLVWDYGHLTQAGSRYIADEILSPKLVE
ncbi:peptidoglycan/LPS O-acetylase OafA/YrhL [Litoreibacter ponti]|uniref:Peptidoglycan/LPS O-acetylase OafA/YrhL n=1 Tax=Litoreibacter ponti TaxID=1510457 RepID=A0A2T6BIF6_9RHOB|nr:acyltransferase family protein [Litoreibacter ponti]PTX55838.1 peptidoglycan/LPS O-acetylase OafA/YrhL [Litoreibacter ponti]